MQRHHAYRIQLQGRLPPSPDDDPRNQQTLCHRVCDKSEVRCLLSTVGTENKPVGGQRASGIIFEMNHQRLPGQLSRPYTSCVKQRYALPGRCGADGLRHKRVGWSLEQSGRKASEGRRFSRRVPNQSRMARIGTPGDTDQVAHDVRDTGRRQNGVCDAGVRDAIRTPLRLR
jgi:hypothetical protein